MAEKTNVGSDLGKRLPSGLLNEESSHYHLLYTQRYIDVWLAAVRHGSRAADGQAAGQPGGWAVQHNQ